MPTIRLDRRQQVDRPRDVPRLLVGVELGTGAAAVVGGLLLALRPDGSLLQAHASALSHSPFSDWRVPGLLLASLLGVGFLAAGWWQHRLGRCARELSVAAGAGLVLFEAFELVWIGPQPLEAVFAVVGLTVVVLAVRLPAPTDADTHER